MSGENAPERGLEEEEEEAPAELEMVGLGSSERLFPLLMLPLLPPVPFHRLSPRSDPGGADPCPALEVLGAGTAGDALLVCWSSKVLP